MLKQKGIGAGAGGPPMSKKEPLIDAATRIVVINFERIQYLAKDLQNGKVVEVIGRYVKSAGKREELTAGDNETIFKHPHMARFYLLQKLESSAANLVMMKYNMSRGDGETEI